MALCAAGMNECLFQLCFSAYSLNVSDFQNPRPFRDRKTLPLRLCSVAQPLHGPQTRASDSSLSLSPHLEEPHGSWAMRLGADSAARGACTPALAPFINTPHLIALLSPPAPDAQILPFPGGAQSPPESLLSAAVPTLHARVGKSEWKVSSLPFWGLNSVLAWSGHRARVCVSRLQLKGEKISRVPRHFSYSRQDGYLLQTGNAESPGSHWELT